MIHCIGKNPSLLTPFQQLDLDLDRFRHGADVVRSCQHVISSHPYFNNSIFTFISLINSLTAMLQRTRCKKEEQWSSSQVPFSSHICPCSTSKLVTFFTQFIFQLFIQFIYFLIMIFSISVRLGLRHKPVLRDRLFTAVLAGAFLHGGYLVYPFFFQLFYVMLLQYNYRVV